MESICFPPSAFCFVLSAFCLLQLVGLLPRCAVYDKMSPPAGKEKTSNFKN